MQNEEKKCPSSLRESIHFLSLSQKRQNKSSRFKSKAAFRGKSDKETNREKNWCFRQSDFVFFVRQSVLIKGLLLSLISREENARESLLRKKVTRAMREREGKKTAAFSSFKKKKKSHSVFNKEALNHQTTQQKNPQKHGVF